MNEEQQATAQAACEQIGVIFQVVPADGNFHQLDVDGKAARNGAGRIKVYADGEGGQVWNHVTGDTLQFWTKSNQTFTPAEHEERKRRAKAESVRAEQELAEAREKAAEKAQEVVKAAATPPKDNPYLKLKLVDPTATIREIMLEALAKIIGYHPQAKGKPFSNGKVLIVPVNDGTKITTIEMIDETGLKAGLKDGQKKGCFWRSHPLPKTGKGEGLTIGIGEGVATMLTYHQAGGNTGIAALSCNNLKAVALYFRNRYPAARIEIISDVGNGEQAALEAARAVAGWLTTPDLADGSTGSDINDQHKQRGLQSVKDTIKAARQIEVIGSEATTDKSADQWPEPSPLPEGLPPVIKLSPEMIPAPFRGWLVDIAHRMQSAIDFAAAAAIVALGSVIGRGCGIYPKQHDNWLVVPNLFGAGIGDPSVMKTPTIAEGTKPLERLEIEAKQEHEAGQKAADDNQEIEEITRTVIREQLKAAIKGGKAEKEAEARAKCADLDNEAPPTRRRYQTQDGTTEKIGELLNQNPRGILINRDELIGWFHSLDKAGRESDRGFYLEAWNGTGRFTYDRIGRGTLDIEALCISIFGAITPGPLSDYIRATVRGGIGNDGLLQRFQVMVYPDHSTEWINIDRYPDTEQKNRAFKIFKTLSGNIPGAVIEEGASIPALRFTPAGQETFNQWRHDLETRLRSDHGLHPAMVSHLAKYRSLMPSLALIFHLIEVADGTTEPGPVSERAAVMAAAWCQYLESHAGRVYGGIMAPGMDAAKEIVKHIRRGAIQDGATVREVWRHQWSRLTSSEEVKAGLNVLTEYDWLIVEKITAGNRPTEIIRLNPKINI